MDPANNRPQKTFIAPAPDLNQNSVPEKLGSFEKEKQYKVLTREELVRDRSGYAPGSPKYLEIDAALRNHSMPFYKDNETGRKYCLLNGGGLLGGGNVIGTESPKKASFLLSESESLSIKMKSDGMLYATFFSEENSEIQTSTLFVNGIEVNQLEEKDRNRVISSLINRVQTSPLTVKCSNADNSIEITTSSRPLNANPLLLTACEVRETSVNSKYSIIESLDEDYVNCALAPDEQIEDASEKFIEKYKGLLKEAEWDEERIDISIRKATLEGLKIALIPMYRFDLFGPQTQKMIRLFDEIESDIKILNLSLDLQETIDFHMYRGFIFSRLPVHMYPKQREISISDGMITISAVDQLLKNKNFKPNRIFYKKMAYAFSVFAKGMDNPPVAIKFIELGKQFVVECKKNTTFRDPMLRSLEASLNELHEERSKKMIQLDLIGFDTNQTKDIGSRLLMPQNIQNDINIDKQVDYLEPMDQIVFRFVQGLYSSENKPLKVKACIEELKGHLSRCQDKRSTFRLQMRLVFVRNYYNYLQNKENWKKFQSELKSIVADLNSLSKQIASEDLLVQAEYLGFAGCVYITFPRFGEMAQCYDQAIINLNKLSKLPISLHKDVLAYLFITYGEHMLQNDPLNAVPLLKQAIEMSPCENLQSQAEQTLNKFLGTLQPVRPCLQFNTGSLLNYK